MPRLAHVVGLGRSGKAAARLLARHDWQVLASDDNPSPLPEDDIRELASLGVKLLTGGHDEALRTQVELTVTSPGVPWGAAVLEARRRQGCRVISELELGWMHSQGTLAAVTGSNGKTTTTALLGAIFAASGRPAFTCGNIGLPLAAVADDTDGESLLAVEASSFQLEGIDGFHPRVAVLLNLTPDHLDRHGGETAYAAAKARIWENQRSDDWVVFFVDDPAAAELTAKAPSRRFPFSIEDELTAGAFLKRDELVCRMPSGGERRFRRSDLKLPGRHNSANALAAVAAALLVGIDPAPVSAALAQFQGVPHRLETVRELDGVLWVNDSKATNVDAGRWALEAFDRPVVLIAGGRSKGGGFRALRAYAQGKVKRMILIGEAVREIADDLGDLAPVTPAEDLSAAVDEAHRAAQVGDVVLLAPLCASFDMFRDYEERGDRFKALVERL